ncbi:unnamed protein product [Sphenostylis stenocarpa]|uniref:Uncharacterized protein n=1 Tax=Sphenostylis stenocarpa TaxID=92480 RepID=A0AA86VM57_9FABA|nr:unnamed protein product [Sphenostylis stenocarpa]
MGIVKILAWLIAIGQLIFDWFPIIGPFGKPAKRDTALHVQMKFTLVEENLLYQRGIATDPEHCEVRNTYFPVRKGSSVRLYQDAQCPESSKGKLPEVKLENGEVYRHGKCWEGICYAISEAHHMVYLVGWSISHKVKLVREPTRTFPRGDLTLGELLKCKSEEGMRVLLLVWDDKTSHDKILLKTVRILRSFLFVIGRNA